MSLAEERRILSKRKIARFSDLILCKEAWFRVANDLLAAMALLEPQIEKYWQKVNSQLEGGDSDEPPPLGLVTVHMMLAAFTIENFCKAFLVTRLTPQEHARMKAGILPKSLKDHDIIALIERTGLPVSDTDKYLLKMIRDAGWRGRYPIPVSHEQIQPFVQMASGIRRTKSILDTLRKHVGG